MTTRQENIPTANSKLKLNQPWFFLYCCVVRSKSVEQWCCCKSVCLISWLPVPDGPSCFSELLRAFMCASLGPLQWNELSSFPFQIGNAQSGLPGCG